MGGLKARNPGLTCSRGPPSRVALDQRIVRRRPTLPQPLGCSTIGAERLNFRVRDGSGCFPFAMAAVTLVPTVHLSHCPVCPLCCAGFWGAWVCWLGCG